MSLSPRIVTLRAPDAHAMQQLGAALAARLRPGDALLLDGGLGAGKTTLARAVIAALAGERDVPSPTYTLVQIYGADPEVWHADLYRLERPEDVLPLGLLDVSDEVVSLIEWPERLGRLRPAHALDVEIAFDGTGRSVVLRGDSAWGQRLDDFEF